LNRFYRLKLSGGVSFDLFIILYHLLILRLLENCSGCQKNYSRELKTKFFQPESKSASVKFSFFVILPNLRLNFYKTKKT
jgi:hypothetical protein